MSQSGDHVAVRSYEVKGCHDEVQQKVRSKLKGPDNAINDEEDESKQERAGHGSEVNGRLSNQPQSHCGVSHQSQS